jgi:uncharacterized protein Usg
MGTIASAALSSVMEAPRIRVFVDYWNLQLTMNEHVKRITGQPEIRFPIDWRKLSGWLKRLPN